ncbi:MAG: hypothetical protein COX79_01800 [Candidatus Levybacteria bacterium CG_4_10_14_0_2_um_filter_36_16]|nr:MAG: hypothetical protein AUK12_00360 [Candidatus Levybacteria bacterium CG2_30_37_29]PIR79282.1 MAG: hypothetical protein COU26_02005 [Candidatus Levybacteria bacterium CG10_big_fil_rev_8_21_14_0_10_36_30]PIZ97567.1 MAG: hypothetical protein COX79_01800 [Candidatus Levybacteria bacterium CG_4_10_14_0_2_um_filter_36_16]
MGRLKDIRILLLEDDVETLSLLLQCLYKLQKHFEDRLSIAITVLSEYTQVEEYLNKVSRNVFDIILLDRDCFASGSFHVLDFNKYPPNKIIGISSIPPYNQELEAKGVKRIVWKDYQNLHAFVEQVKGHLEEMLLQTLGRS